MDEAHQGITYTLIPFQELSVDELYAIMRLRQEVFVVEQNCPYLDADGKDPLSYHVLGKNAEGALVCYTRLLPEGVSYEGFCSIGRVINALSVRRQGHGKKLMEVSIREIRALFPGTPIKIGAQAYLKSFYELLGFVDLNQPYLEDGIPHLKMVLM